MNCLFTQLLQRGVDSKTGLQECVLGPPSSPAAGIAFTQPANLAKSVAAFCPSGVCARARRRDTHNAQATQPQSSQASTSHTWCSTSLSSHHYCMQLVAASGKAWLFLRAQTGVAVRVNRQVKSVICCEVNCPCVFTSRLSPLNLLFEEHRVFANCACFIWELSKTAVTQSNPA
jgi:hypothetical protein